MICAFTSKVDEGVAESGIHQIQLHFDTGLVGSKREEVTSLAGWKHKSR